MVTSNPPPIAIPADDETPNRIDALAQEFVTRLRAGQRPAISEYVDRFPDLADEIGAVFPALAMLEQVGKDVSLTGGSNLSVPTLEQLGEYRIIREIGRGGMGVVYEAEHSSMRRRVALKVMPAGMARNATYLRRFRREARAAGGLHHTNVVPVFEVGHHDGIHFYAMQYILGQSLDLVIKELYKLVHAGSATSESKPQSTSDNVPRRTMESIAARLLSGIFVKPLGPVEESDSRIASATEGADSSSHVALDDNSDRSLIDAVSPHARRTSYFQRVAHLGLQIADALAYAHAHGVLHRDIKPSNLILDTAGVVWITDFGLAKYEEDDLTRSGDIVGTLRYLAPERLNGQADARGDVYALGLTLYELCALRAAFDESDRVRLIKQVTSETPPAPRRLNRFIPRDLETIILKAIDKQPGSRYQTAEEMADDLRLFVADRPLQSRRSPATERVWRWCRRNPSVASLAACVLLLLGIVVCGSLGFAISTNRQAGRLREKTELLQTSEMETLAALYDARRSQAKAARFSERRGQRVEGLNGLREAALLVPRLYSLPQDRTEAHLALRNDAIANLANPDLRIERSWTVRDPWTTVTDFDADFHRYAQADATGAIVVRHTSDNRELARFPSPGCPAWQVQFSPNGKYLAAKYHPTRTRPREINVWNLETQQQIVNDKGPFVYGPFAFSPDGRMFITCLDDKTINIYDLPDGTLREVGPRTESQALQMAIDPASRSFVVSDADSFSIERIDLGDGTREIHRTANYIHSLTWSNDGSQLAGGCEDGNIYLWNSNNLANPTRTLRGHTAGVVNVVICHRDDRLASYAWDGTTRLWDLRTDRQLVRADAVRIVGNHFANDDSQIGYASKRDEFGIWEVIDRGPLYILASAAKVRSNIEYSRDPKGFAISATSDGIELWDTASSRLLNVLPSGPSTMAKPLPDGSAIISSGDRGIQRWPFTRPGLESQIGSPETITTAVIKGFDLDSMGQSLVALKNTSIISIDLSDPSYPETEIGTHEGSHQIATSPDGRWIVTTTWNLGSGIKIWDRTRREFVKDLAPEMGAATAAFSPDGKWLATGVWRNFSVWEVGTWNLQHQLDRDQDDDWSPSLAFSPDSSVYASHYTRRSIQLVATRTGQRLAVLESSEPGMIGRMQFNSDGSELAAVLDNRLQIWSLKQLRGQLFKIGLDWEAVGVFPPGAGADLPSGFKRDVQE